MASLYDQYEQQMSSVNRVNSIQQEDSQYARSQPKSEDQKAETPIFQKLKIQFKPPQPLTHLVASSNILVMAMSDKNLLKVDRDCNPEELPMSTQLGAPANQFKVHKIFLDPLGNHVFVSLEHSNSSSNINLHVYVGPDGKRSFYRFLKGHLISAVAFNPSNVQNVSTGRILLSTTKGEIFEAELSASDGDWTRFNKQSNEKFCKSIYQMKGGIPITGIHMEIVKNAVDPSLSQTVVFVSTARQIYRFYGEALVGLESPHFERLFASSETFAYNNSVELPNPTKDSQLQVLVPIGQQMATNMACLFGPVGVYQAELIENNRLNDQQTLWLVYRGEPKIVDLTSRSESSTDTEQPLSMVVTNYHILVLFKTKFRAYCHVNRALVAEDNFSGDHRMIGCTRDVSNGLIWAFSENSVYRFKIDKESRNMWKVFMDLGEYEEASLFCRDDPQKLDKIRIRQALDFFKKNRYEESARLFSQTQSSFEEISLKFLEVEQDTALRILLKEKLYSLAQDQNQKPQLVMIITWLVQMYLNKLGHLKHQLTKDAGNEIHLKEYNSLNDEFHNLLSLKSVRESIIENKKPFYKLITSHGDESLLQKFSKLMGDFEYVVQMHIQNKRFEEALKILQERRSFELYYRFSAELMPHLPKELVDSWMKEPLDPVRLIPALVQYTEADFDPRAPQMTESIRYLEYIVEKCHCGAESIHNYLIALYAALGDAEKLDKYLQGQGMDISMISYDAKYALRVFSEEKLLKACVHVYSVMGLYAEAIELALNGLGDTALSEQIANMPEDEEARKKLWLMIAKHGISKNLDIKEAMQFLKACDLLKIEDILPFFPEFASIDHFKKDICESLQSYKGCIEELKLNMEQATDATDKIKKEIQDVKNRCFVVDRSHKCSSCGFGLLNQSFYIFPCMHRFHAECLQQETQPYLGKLDEVKELSESGNQRVETSSRASSQQGTEKLADDVIAAECLYCGELMAESIDQPFFEPESYERILRKWL